MVHIHGHKNVHKYTKNDFVPFCEFVYFSENHVFMSMWFFFQVCQRRIYCNFTFLALKKTNYLYLKYTS